MNVNTVVKTATSKKEQILRVLLKIQSGRGHKNLANKNN